MSPLSQKGVFENAIEKIHAIAIPPEVSRRVSEVLLRSENPVKTLMMVAGVIASVGAGLGFLFIDGAVEPIIEYILSTDFSASCGQGTDIDVSDVCEFIRAGESHFKDNVQGIENVSTILKVGGSTAFGFVLAAFGLGFMNRCTKHQLTELLDTAEAQKAERLQEVFQKLQRMIGDTVH